MNGHKKLLKKSYDYIVDAIEQFLVISFFWVVLMCLFGGFSDTSKYTNKQFVSLPFLLNATRN